MNRTYMSRLGLIVYLVTLCSVVSALAQRRPLHLVAPSRPPAIDYSKFSHATKKHQGACDTCHQVPTQNWQKTNSYPDIIDYPGHASCVSCHRAQFFRSARPPICSVCHTKVSPRDDARFAFRNPASRLQFSIVFPHDKHQDVIAQLEIPAQTERPTFRRVVFSHSSADDKSPLYNNCTICHSQQTVGPKPGSDGWLDGFVPDVSSFKSAPSTHSSCFNCHWKSQEPVASNCGGCHTLAATPYTAANDTCQNFFKVQS